MSLSPAMIAFCIVSSPSGLLIAYVMRLITSSPYGTWGS